MADSSVDRAIEQIKKIMRLANRAGTPGEAEAAKAAARRIADKAGVRIDDIAFESADVRTVDECDRLWTSTKGDTIGFVTGIIRRHFGVIIMQEIDPKRRTKAILHWIGTPVNIDIARHVFVILMRESERGFREAKIRNVAARQSHRYLSRNLSSDTRISECLAVMVPPKQLDRRSFLEGWFFAIHQTLERFPLRNDQEQFEAERKAAEAKFERMKEQDGEIEEKSARDNANRHGKQLDRTSIAYGIEMGEKVRLNRPCEGREPSPSPLLTGRYKK